MHSEIKTPRSLREIEEGTSRKLSGWMRQRLQQKLQEEANRCGELFPLSTRRASHRQWRRLRLRTAGVMAASARRCGACRRSKRRVDQPATWRDANKAIWRGTPSGGTTKRWLRAAGRLALGR